MPDAFCRRGEEVRLLGELPVVVERVRQEELVTRRHERGPHLLHLAQLPEERLTTTPVRLGEGELRNQTLFVDRGKPGRLAPDDDPVVVGGQDVVFQKRIDRRRERDEMLARRLLNLGECHARKVRVDHRLTSSHGGKGDSFTATVRSWTICLRPPGNRRSSARKEGCLQPGAAAAGRPSRARNRDVSARAR